MVSDLIIYITFLTDVVQVRVVFDDMPINMISLNPKHRINDIMGATHLQEVRSSFRMILHGKYHPPDG